jgi:hypothetical protein
MDSSISWSTTKISAKHVTNILDYSSRMSMYEKESLVAEARLAADRKLKKPAKQQGSSTVIPKRG